MAGGCSGTYWRKGFWFETGATTLVGLGDACPYTFDELGINLTNVRGTHAGISRWATNHPHGYLSLDTGGGEGIERLGNVRLGILLQNR